MSSLTAYVSINFLSQQNHKSQMEQDRMPRVSAGRLPLVCSATVWTNEHLHANNADSDLNLFLKLPEPGVFLLP